MKVYAIRDVATSGARKQGENGGFASLCRHRAMRARAGRGVSRLRRTLVSCCLVLVGMTFAALVLVMALMLGIVWQASVVCSCTALLLILVGMVLSSFMNRKRHETEGSSQSRAL